MQFSFSRSLYLMRWWLLARPETESLFVVWWKNPLHHRKCGENVADKIWAARPGPTRPARSHNVFEKLTSLELHVCVRLTTTAVFFLVTPSFLPCIRLHSTDWLMLVVTNYNSARWGYGSSNAQNSAHSHIVDALCCKHFFKHMRTIQQMSVPCCLRRLCRSLLPGYSFLIVSLGPPAWLAGTKQHYNSSPLFPCSPFSLPDN